MCLRLIPLAVGAVCALHAIGAGDDHKSARRADISLSAAQRLALGIVIGHAVTAKNPERLKAFGRVLDTSSLVADIAELTALTAAKNAATTEVTRLQSLYRNGGDASPKMIETAAVEESKASAQAQAAQARLRQHWNPLIDMAPPERQKLVNAIGQGRMRLLRADLPGQHSLVSLPTRAQVDIDGLNALGSVLGLMQIADDTQSVGLMVALAKAPPGLSAGARVPVVLLTAPQSGLLLPSDAILYDEHGAYVFEQHVDKSGTGQAHFAHHDIGLVMPQSNGWLVTGLDADDDIVVEGAGAVWSLEGSAGGRNPGSDDND